MRRINLLTVTQAAGIIGVSPAYMRHLVATGRIPATITPLRGYLLAYSHVQEFKVSRDAWKARAAQRTLKRRDREHGQHTPA